VAKKSDKRDTKKARKASAKSDRELLELGEDLLTAVHLHHAVEDDDVRAALASAHPGLVQAAGDLVARIAARFLDESGVDVGERDRPVHWPRGEVGAGADEAGDGTRPEDAPDAAH
jgi:hypothetical protein